MNVLDGALHNYAQIKLLRENTIITTAYLICLSMQPYIPFLFVCVLHVCISSCACIHGFYIYTFQTMSM